MKECDLYPPLKAFLEGQGYEVKGEVQGCDVVAVRDAETPVVVELKLNLNLELILQAVDRLAVSETVYLGVPAGAGWRKRRKPLVKLLRMLGVGLIAIDVEARTGAVDVVLDPGEYRPRRSKAKHGRLLAEFAQRVGDPNVGGSAMRRGLMTAYRQRALALARFLDEQGPTKASAVAAELGEPKAREILYNNVYGWFERHGKGVYGLSPRGAEAWVGWVTDGTDPGAVGAVATDGQPPDAGEAA